MKLLKNLLLIAALILAFLFIKQKFFSKHEEATTIEQTESTAESADATAEAPVADATTAEAPAETVEATTEAAQ